MPWSAENSLNEMWSGFDTTKQTGDVRRYIRDHLVKAFEAGLAMGKEMHEQADRNRRGTEKNRILRMAGRCSSGAERDGGARYHAVLGTGDWAKAVCGAAPGPRGNGWSAYPGEAVTCPRCAAKLAKQTEST